jgi:hypothetical protein
MRRAALLLMLVLLAVVWMAYGVLNSEEVLMVCDYADRSGGCVEVDSYFVWGREMTAASIGATVLIIAAVLLWRRPAWLRRLGSRST